MSNSGKKLDVPNQLGLFEMILKAKDMKNGEPREGSLDIQVPWRKILTDVVSTYKDGIYKGVARMSEFLGSDVTANMIYSYKAPSKETNNMPAVSVPAFCFAFKNFRPIEFLAEMTNRYLLPDRDALRSEIQKIEEDMEILRQEKERRLLFLEQVDKK